MEGGGIAVPMQPQSGQPGFFHMPRLHVPAYQKPAMKVPFNVNKAPPGGAPNQGPSQNRGPPGQGANVEAQGVLFDGKRMRKPVHRKTVDYNSSVIKYLENRIWQRDFRDAHAIQPDNLYLCDILPPSDMLDDPMNCLTTKFMRQSTNKFRCPIFCLAWTPEGRRLVTGASSGEFTLWNGLTFNFETILQAHDTSVRAMVWSHNDQWMVTGDHSGFIKYWQSNMNNVKMYQGHKEAIRSISFCPTDAKFASGSDDGTVRVWDFMRCYEEKILRGHGADVKCVDWHPQKSLIASGSKDNQVPIKLWDPKSGTSLATLHAHKFTVMDLKWNKNGNWLLTASRDHLMKLFDIRNMKEELQVFKGHKKEATAIAWHPISDQMFASGGSDGAIMFWNAGVEKEVGAMEEAHDAIIWDLVWHPMGHILSSASNDHSTKFWTRNRPGDAMRDKYNLNLMPLGADGEILDPDLDLPLSEIKSKLPGMGLEDIPAPDPDPKDVSTEEELPAIPGLDWSTDEQFFKEQAVQHIPRKKIPFSRPIPKTFEQAWISNKQPGLLVPKDVPDEMDNKLEESGKTERRKNKKKIKSLLSLDMPKHGKDEMQQGPPMAGQQQGGMMPPGRMGMPGPGQQGDMGDFKLEQQWSAQGGDVDFRFTQNSMMHQGGADQDFRMDQDYRGDQDLRLDQDFRMDQDFRGQGGAQRGHDHGNSGMGHNRNSNRSKGKHNRYGNKWNMGDGNRSFEEMDYEGYDAGDNDYRGNSENMDYDERVRQQSPSAGYDHQGRDGNRGRRDDDRYKGRRGGGYRGHSDSPDKGSQKRSWNDGPGGRGGDDWGQGQGTDTGPNYDNSDRSHRGRGGYRGNRGGRGGHGRGGGRNRGGRGGYRGGRGGQWNN